MKYTKVVLIFVTFLTSLYSAQAADLSGHISVGMGKSVLDARTFERLGAIGVSFGNTWRVQANGGYWFAPAAGERSSLYGSLQGGLEVVGDGGTFAGIMFGPAVIQHDDSKLSGNFQFHLTPSIGIKSDSGYRLAFCWNHWSNAGILKGRPNLGRDVLTLMAVIPIWKAKR